MTRTTRTNPLEWVCLIKGDSILPVSLSVSISSTFWENRTLRHVRKSMKKGLLRFLLIWYKTNLKWHFSDSALSTCFLLTNLRVCIHRWRLLFCPFCWTSWSICSSSCWSLRTSARPTYRVTIIQFTPMLTLKRTSLESNWNLCAMWHLVWAALHTSRKKATKVMKRHHHHSRRNTLSLIWLSPSMQMALMFSCLPPLPHLQ